jgi:hypothetical protein
MPDEKERLSRPYVAGHDGHDDMRRIGAKVEPAILGFVCLTELREYRALDAEEVEVAREPRYLADDTEDDLAPGEPSTPAQRRSQRRRRDCSRRARSVTSTPRVYLIRGKNLQTPLALGARFPGTGCSLKSLSEKRGEHGSFAAPSNGEA